MKDFRIDLCSFMVQADSENEAEQKARVLLDNKKIPVVIEQVYEED